MTTKATGPVRTPIAPSGYAGSVSTMNKGSRDPLGEGIQQSSDPLGAGIQQIKEPVDKLVDKEE